VPFDPFELLWRPAPEDQNEFLESYLEEDSRLGVDGEGAQVLYGYGERQEGQGDSIEYYRQAQNPNLNTAFSVLEGAYRPGQDAFESPTLATALVEPARELLKRPQASDLVSRAEKAFSDVWYSPLNQNREALSYHLHWQQRSLGMELERTREKRNTDLTSAVQRAWQAADKFPTAKRDAQGLPRGFLSRPKVSDYQAMFAQGTRLAASYFQFEQMDVISSLPEQYDIAVALPSRIFSPTPILHQPSLEQGYDYEGQALTQARIHGGTLMAATVLDDPSHQRRIYGKIAPLSFHPKVGYVEDESEVKDESRIAVSWIGTQNLTKALERNRTMENILVFQGRAGSGISASQQRFERDVSQEIATATHTLLNLGTQLNEKHGIIVPGQFEQNLPKSNYLRADGQIIYEIADALQRFRDRENAQVVFSSWQFSLFTEQQHAGRLMVEMKSNLLALASEQRLTVLLDAGTFDELHGVYQKHLRGTLTQADRLKYDVDLITSLMENQAFFRAPSPFHHEKSMFVFDRNSQQLEFLMTGSANISRASLLPINLQSPERQQAVKDLYRRTLGRELTDEDLDGTLETELNIFLERGRSAGEDEYLGMITPQVMQHLNYNLHRYSRPGYIHYELADSSNVQRLKQDIEILQQQLGSGVNLEVKEKWSQPSWQSTPGSRKLVGLRVTVSSSTGIPDYRTSLEVTVGADGSIILPSRNQILSGSVYYNRGLFAKVVPGSPGEKILPGTSKIFTPQQTLLSILTGLGSAMNEQAMGQVIGSVFRNQFLPIGTHTTARFLRAAYNSRRGDSLGDFLVDLAKGEYTNARQFYGRELTPAEVQTRLESFMTLEQIFNSKQDNYSKFLMAAQVMNYQMTNAEAGLYGDIMYYLIGQTPLKERMQRSVRAQVRELENLVLLGAIEQNSTLYGYAQMKHRLSVIGTTVDDTLPSFGDVAAFNPLPMRATGSMGIGSNGQFLRLIGAQGYQGRATIGGMRSIAMTVSSLDEESIFFYNFPELAQSLPQMDYLTKDKLKERYQIILSILGEKEAELAADSEVFESFGGAQGMYFFMLPASKLEQFMQRFKNLVGARQALQVSPQLYQDLLHGHTDNLPSEAGDIYTDTFRSVMAPHSYQRFQAMVQQYNGDVNAALREFRRLDSSPFTSEKGVLAPAIRRIEVVAGKHPMTDFYYLNDDPNLSHPYAFSEVMQLRIQPHQVDSKVDTVSKLEQIFTHPTLLITKAQDLPASSQLVQAFYEYFHLPANASYSAVSANLALARGSSHDRFAFGLGQSLSVEKTARGRLSFKLRAGLYSLQPGDDGREMWQKVGDFTEDGRIIIAGGRSKEIAGKSYYEPIFITNRAFNLRHQDAIAYYYGDLAREEDPITGRITLTKNYTVIAQPTSGIRSFDLFKGPGVFLKKKYFDQQFGEGSDVYALATTSHFKSYSFTSAHHKLKTDMDGLRALTGRQLAVLLFPIFGAKGEAATSAYLQAASSHPGVTPLGLAALRNVAGKYRDYTADPDQARATGQARLGLSLQGLTILLNDPQAAAAAMQQGSVRPVAELITRALTDDQAAAQLAQGYQRLLDYYSQNPLNIHAVNLGDPVIKALLAVVDTIDIQRQVLQKISSPRPGVTVGDAHIVTENPDDPRYQAGYEFIRAAEGFGTRATSQSSRTARIAAQYTGDPRSAVIYMGATGNIPYAQMMQKASKLLTTFTNKIHLTHYADPQMSNLGELEVIDPTTPGGYTTFVMRFSPAFYPDISYRAEQEAKALSEMVSLDIQAEAAMDTLVHESIHLVQALYALQQSSPDYYLPLSLRPGQRENYSLVPYLGRTEQGRLELYTIFNNYDPSDWSVELEAFSFQRQHDNLQNLAELYLNTPFTIQHELFDPTSALFKRNRDKLALIQNMTQVRQEYGREWTHLTKFQTNAVANTYQSPQYTASQAQSKYLGAQADDALRQFLRSQKGEKHVRNLALQMFGSKELVQALYEGSDSRLQKNWRTLNQTLAYAKYIAQTYPAIGSQSFLDYAAATVMLNPLTHALAYRLSQFTDVPDRPEMLAGLAIMADPELMAIAHTNPNDLTSAIANRVTRFSFFYQSMASSATGIHHNFAYSLFPDTFPGGSVPAPAVVTQPATMPRFAGSTATPQRVNRRVYLNRQPLQRTKVAPDIRAVTHTPDTAKQLDDPSTAYQYYGNPKLAQIYMAATGSVPYDQVMKKATRLLDLFSSNLPFTHKADENLGAIAQLRINRSTGQTRYEMRFLPTFYPQPLFKYFHKAIAQRNLVSLDIQAEVSMDTLTHESIHLIQALTAVERNSPSLFTPISLQTGQQEDYTLIPYVGLTEKGRLNLYTVFDAYTSSKWKVEIEAISFEREHDSFIEFAETYFNTPISSRGQLLDVSSATFKQNRHKLGFVEKMAAARRRYNQEWKSLTKFQIEALSGIYDPSLGYTASEAQTKRVARSADAALHQFLRSKKGEEHLRGLATQMFGSTEIAEVLYEGAGSRLEKNWQTVNQLMEFSKYISRSYPLIRSQDFLDYSTATVMLNPFTHALAYHFSKSTDVQDRPEMLMALAFIADPELMKIANTDRNDLFPAISDRVSRFTATFSRKDKPNRIHHNYYYTLFPDTFQGSSVPARTTGTQLLIMDRLAGTNRQNINTPSSDPPDFSRMSTWDRVGLLISKIRLSAYYSLEGLLNSNDVTEGLYRRWNNLIRPNISQYSAEQLVDVIFQIYLKCLQVLRTFQMLRRLGKLLCL
jgi:hypothetical protein